MIKIDKDIPIPAPKNGKRKEVSEALFSMSIGDSFKMDYKDDYDFSRSAAKIHGASYKIREKEIEGYKVTIRKDRHTKSFRVWRVN